MSDARIRQREGDARELRDAFDAATDGEDGALVGRA
jgi:hypothetical protein